MQAAMLHAIGDLRIEDVPSPVITDPYQVVVQVLSAGVCGSDLDRVMKTGTYTFPTIPGHEFCGKVLEVGDKVTRFKVGDRVAVAPILPCFECEHCQQGHYGQCDHYNYLGSRCNGGFAEYVVAPEKNLIMLPDSIGDQHAAMIEPAAVTLHGMMRIGIQAGDKVVILGCGTIGLFAIQFARILGATQIIAVDIDDNKLLSAVQVGATQSINAARYDAVKAIIDDHPQGADVVIETAGTNITQVQAISVCKKQGRILYLGTAHREVVIPPQVFERIIRNEITLTGSWNSFSAPFPGREWQAVIDYMASGQLDVGPYITHTITLTELPAMIKNMAERRMQFNKVIVNVTTQ